jgi:hypothetical protein
VLDTTAPCASDAASPVAPIARANAPGSTAAVSTGISGYAGIPLATGNEPVATAVALRPSASSRRLVVTEE